MKNIQLIAAAGAAALFVSACATPRVVEAQQAGDRNLSCAEIMQQIDEARQFEEAARDDRSVNTTNVAAAVFFWPALVGTYMNTEEAIEAAQDRREHLNRLYENKGC
ncbi:hypothetical protein L2D01_09200 [Hyphomonadaceae bacterium ML37]|nr:hypothetical protein L2D01_09200 [Hyphomonadaceae bacterium ML37]